MDVTQVVGIYDAGVYSIVHGNSDFVLFLASNKAERFWHKICKSYSSTLSLMYSV
jgi:hypothetical protein